MVALALIALAGVFALLFVLRVGGAYRRVLMARWPAVLLAGAALFSLARGAVWPALVLAGLAAAAWFYWPRIRPPQGATDRPDTPAESQARAVLGVPADATESDIRRAYREKMRSAHPDRGGSHERASQLSAARDTLLRKQR
ncbi:MAG: J domain-containing protein [Hyphomonadaceae bacterium]|nr:J domain-containing protein [Hyphomonadaceae bacterium]